MLLFSININCVFINHSVVCRNHIVVSINHTVVYRNLHGKNTFLRVTIQENYSFFICYFTKFFSYIMWLVFSGGVKIFPNYNHNLSSCVKMVRNGGNVWDNSF